MLITLEPPLTSSCEVHSVKCTAVVGARFSLSLLLLATHTWYGYTGDVHQQRKRVGTLSWLAGCQSSSSAAARGFAFIIIRLPAAAERHLPH